MKAKDYYFEICYRAHSLEIKTVIIKIYSDSVWIALDEFKDMNLGDFLSIQKHENI